MPSFITKLKNKIAYTINNAVDDPDANEYAKQQKNNPDKDEDNTSPVIPSIATDIIGDPTKFDPVRFVKQIGSSMVEHSSNWILVVLSIIIAMYITNEMIVYSAPIRLIFFIFTIVITLAFTPILLFLVAYYICKAVYSYYIDKYTEQAPKVPILPTIYSLLPLMKVPSNSIFALLLYPFTYPKSHDDADLLKDKMEEYMELLKESFSSYDKIMELKPLVEKIEKNIATMHPPVTNVEIIEVVENETKNEEKNETKNETKNEKKNEVKKPTAKFFAPGPANNENNVTNPSSNKPEETPSNNLPPVIQPKSVDKPSNNVLPVNNGVNGANVNKPNNVEKQLNNLPPVIQPKIVDKPSTNVPSVNKQNTAEKPSNNLPPVIQPKIVDKPTVNVSPVNKPTDKPSNLPPVIKPVNEKVLPNASPVNKLSNTVATPNTVAKP